MKTAVEFLQAEFNKWAEGRVFIPQDILEQAKKMEKEQLIDAYNQADLDAYLQKTYPKYAEKYYNETYNQKKS